MENKGTFLHELAIHVFEAPGRWGWEYREPVPVRPSPHLDAEPLWYEPAGPPGAGPVGSPPWGAGPPPVATAGSALSDSSQADQERRAKMPTRIGICVALAFVGLLVINHGGVILVVAALVMAGIWFLPLLMNASSGPPAARATADRDRAWARYSHDWQTWRTAVQNWDAGEKARVTGDNLWFPVIAADRTSRIDVFGGVPDGWAALATTMGASTLKNGDSILVLDLTEHDISSELLDVARVLEQPSHAWELPAELGQANVLNGLEAEDIAEIVAEAVHSTRESGSADLRGLDADLIRAVAQRLDGEVTFRKLSAGLQVLRRSYDDTLGKASVLSGTELQRLAAYVDAAGQDDQTQQELKILAGNIDLLTTANAGAPASSQDLGFWRAGILVMRTADRNPRRKDFMDRVLAQTVIHHLRSRPARGSSDILFVAGCDHLGLRTLENLTRQARRSGLRTVLILEHLRDDIEKLLGGSDSASLIMRMGNAREAATAAEFIGRGHTFVLNQLTRQLSDAATDGESKQWGASGTVSDTDSSSGGAGFGWSRSRGISRADSWSRTVNWSTTKTQTDGATTSRVYEFTIEPVQIQSMPLTAFMFVEAADGRRRVVAGDCNPGISMLERVARRAPLDPAPPPAPSAPGVLTGQQQPIAPPPGLEPGSRW